MHHIHLDSLAYDYTVWFVMAVRVPFRLYVFLADIMSYTFFLASTYVLCATRTMNYFHLKDLIPIDGLLVRLN